MSVTLLRLGQLVLMLIAGIVALWAPSKPELMPQHAAISLSLLGQRELPDGSWEGVDLLQDASQRVQRAQLSLRLLHPAEVTLEAVDEKGSHVLYPPVGSPTHLKAERTYAFPAPGSFYEVDGAARLRLTVRPVGTAGPSTPLVASSRKTSLRRARLSDGARFEVAEQPFQAQGAGVLELAIGN
jgi:hypothetical protein